MDFKQCPEGDCRLTDFGLSFTCRTCSWENDDDAYTAGVYPLHTHLGYMAPEWFGSEQEQLEAKRSTAADIWD
eukprot:gene43651-18361_t